METNLYSRFKEIAIKYPAQTAIHFKKEDQWVSLTYRQLKDDINSLAAFLAEENVKEGDRVGIILENRPEWPRIFFAAVSIGAIAVPINTEGAEEEIKNILLDCQPKIVFVNKNSFLLKEVTLSGMASAPKVISVDTNQCQPTRLTYEVNLVGWHGSHGSGESAIACLLYTSGTTAEPKGVMLTHKNLLANCQSMSSLNLITTKDSIMSILPLHHTYPLTVTMILPLLYGGKIICPGSIRGEVLLEAMMKLNPTVFVAVPQIFHSFHQKITESLKKIPFLLKPIFNLAAECLYKLRNAAGINLSRFLFFSLHKKFGKSMRLFVSGGAKLDENVEKDLFKFGFTILEGYGLTETSPVLTINPLKNPKIGSVGPPIPDVEIKLADKNEKGIGEVLAVGPNIMKGYYKRDDLTAEVIKDGWFHTGDLGFIDKDGYLFLTGRAKDVIVLSSGLNIDPEEVEKAYSRNVPLKELCVFEISSVRGMKERDVLWAVVVPDLEFFRKYGEVNLRHVIKERFDNVTKTLAPPKRLMGFTITLEPLPRTLLGKIKRFAVKEIYAPKIAEEADKFPEEPKKLSAQDAELMEKDVAKKIINYLKKETKIKGTIVPRDTLELDLGIDSLGRIDLAAGLDKLFGVPIKDEILGQAFTVRDLILGVESFLKEGAKESIGAMEEKKMGSEDWKKALEIPPRKENLDRIDMNPGFGAWMAGFLFTLLNIAFFKLFCNLKAEGKENVPEKGPYILYANHTSYFDGFLVASSLPRFPRLELFFVGFRPYLTVPVTRNLVKIGRMIPLDFSTHLLEALRSSFYVLKNRKGLCLFPEGLRTLDGNVGQFKRGFGILAKESGAKLVPVFLKGAFEMWPRTAKFPHPHPVKVKFGKPLDVEKVEKEGFELGAKDSYAAICLAARKHLLDLKNISQPTRLTS